jgi:hypothetical protein
MSSNHRKKQFITDENYLILMELVMYEYVRMRARPRPALCTATIADLLRFTFDYPFINPTLRMKCRTLLMGAS